MKEPTTFFWIDVRFGFEVGKLDGVELGTRMGVLKAKMMFGWI